MDLVWPFYHSPKTVSSRNSPHHRIWYTFIILMHLFLSLCVAPSIPHVRSHSYLPSSNSVEKNITFGLNFSLARTTNVVIIINTKRRFCSSSIVCGRETSSHFSLTSFHLLTTSIRWVRLFRFVQFALLSKWDNIFLKNTQFLR